jgi:hypothetical protein
MGRLRPGTPLWMEVMGGTSFLWSSDTFDRLLMYDSFSRADSLIGNGWTGPTWSIIGNKLFNNPTLLGELLTDTSLEANYTAGKCDTLSKSGTPTLVQSADVHSGSKAQEYTSTANGNNVAWAGITPTALDWYRASVWTKRTAGTNGANVALFTQSSVGSTIIASNSAAYRNAVLVRLATNTNTMSLLPCYENSVTVFDTIIADDGSLQKITKSNLFCLAPVATLDYWISITIGLVNSGYEKGAVQGGAFGNFDSATGSFLHAYCDGTKAYLDKYLVGARTNLISATIIYNGPSALELRKNGLSVELWWAGSQVGTTQTLDAVTDAAILANSGMGVFATDPEVYLTNFYAYAQNIALGNSDGLADTVLPGGIRPWYAPTYKIQLKKAVNTPTGPTSELLSTTNLSSRYGFARCDLVLTGAVQGGVVCNLDIQTNPQNYMLAYYDNATGKIVVDQYTSGSKTNLLDETVAYGAGRSIELVRINDDTYRVYYKTSTPSTGYCKEVIAAETGTLNGMFYGVYSSGSGVTIDNFIAAPHNRSINFLPVGDSKTANLDAYEIYMYNRSAYYSEYPYRTNFALGGWTVANLQTNIDAAITAAVGTPDVILINAGINEAGSLPVEATFKSNVAYILDALHTKWANAQILWMYIGDRDHAANCNTINDWIDVPVAARPPWAVRGPDERIFLKGSDNYATYCIADGIHPNAAGYLLTAKQWIAAIG